MDSQFWNLILNWNRPEILMQETHNLHELGIFILGQG